MLFKISSKTSKKIKNPNIQVLSELFQSILGRNLLRKLPSK